ncbi:radical SAM protein [Limibacillus sp. MBR-115]|uniref:radical SAM protein n=1 Tax=Limibacillus sp. MBR-115 TaxID=3156465 RepID=UPI003393FB90
MDAAYIANIEIVGTCNLRCPACAVGNYPDGQRQLGSLGGTMQLARFEAILDKLALESPVPKEQLFVALYSWGEPLIHPKIDLLIRATKERGFQVGVSSNLNYGNHLEKMMLAEPTEVCISLSGFRQATYGRSHRGGDIEIVKSNMQRLAEIREANDLDTKIIVAYHLYRHNCGQDLFEMAELADRLRFTLNPVWALLLPLEKLLAARDGMIAQADQETVANLLLHPDEQFAIARENLDLKGGCDLQSKRIDVDVDGAVRLCCATFERGTNIAADFLDQSLDDLHRRKERSKLCDDCMGCGANRIFMASDIDRWMEIGGPRIAAQGYLNNAGLGRLDAPDLPREQNLQAELIAAHHADDRRRYEAAHAALARRLRLKYGYDAIDFSAFRSRLTQRSDTAKVWRRGFHGPLDPLRLYFVQNRAARRFGLTPTLHGGDDLHDLLALARNWDEGDTRYHATAREIGDHCRRLLDRSAVA